MTSNAEGNKLLLGPSSTSSVATTSTRGFSFGMDYSVVGTRASGASAGGWEYVGSATGGEGVYVPRPSLNSRINDLFFDPSYSYVSVSHDKTSRGESLSVFKSGARTSVGVATHDSMTQMTDKIQSAHQRLTDTNSQLHQVQQRITTICADGNMLHERITTSSGEILALQTQVAKMKKEMAHMHDLLRAENNAPKPDVHVETLQAQVDEMKKEMVLMQDIFSAEMRSVQAQHKKEIETVTNRLTQVEAFCKQFNAL